MPTDEEAQAGHRIILKSGVDSSARTDRNPRAPNHNKDKPRLVDLHWQYATVAEAEADTVVRGEVVWVVALNAPFFFVAGSTAIVDHVQVLSGPLGFGRWLRGQMAIVLDPNCVVFTDSSGHLTDDTRFTYTPSPGFPAPSLLVAGNFSGANQGVSARFIGVIGGHATALIAEGAFSNFSPFDLVNGQLLFEIRNDGGNVSGMGWSIGGGVRAGQTVSFDGTYGFYAVDWIPNGGGGFSFFKDMTGSARIMRLDAAGAHGSATIDSLAGTGTRMVTASSVGLLSTAAVPVVPPDVHLAHVDMDRDDTSIFPNGINRAALGSGILSQAVASSVATLSTSNPHVLTDRDQSSVLPNQLNMGALTQVVTNPVVPGLWPVFAVTAGIITAARYDAPTFRYSQQHGFNGNLFCGGLARGSLFLPIGMGPVDVDQNVPESDFDNWSMPINLPGEYLAASVAIRGEIWINPTTGMGSPDNSLNGTCTVNITNNGTVIGSSSAYAAAATGLKSIAATAITNFSPWPLIGVSLSGTATMGFLRIRVNLIIEMLTH